MPPVPEVIAREQIDCMLMRAMWTIQDAKAVNLYALLTPMMKECIDRYSIPGIKVKEVTDCVYSNCQ